MASSGNMSAVEEREEMLGREGGGTEQRNQHLQKGRWEGEKQAQASKPSGSVFSVTQEQVPCAAPE